MSFRRTAVALLFAAAQMACSCGEDPAVETDAGPSGGDGGTLTDGGNRTDGGYKPDGGSVTIRRQLTIEGQSSFTIATSTTTTLKVLLLEGPDGAIRTPVVGADVHFAISGANPGGASLSALTATTDANGRASVTFSSGTRTQLVKVAVTAERATTVTYQINVTVRAATLKATVKYPPTGAIAMPVTSVKVAVFTPFDCANVNYDRLPTALKEAELAVTGTSVVNPVVKVERIDDGTNVTAVAIVRGNQNAVIAVGCAPATGNAGVTVRSPETPLTIETTARPVVLTGVYHTAAKLHLQQALPQPYAGVITELDYALRDTGNWVADLIIDQAGATGVTADLIRAAAVPIIEDVVIGDGTTEHPGLVPAGVRNGINIAADITGLVTNLEIGMLVDVKSATATSFSGHERWERMLFHWRAGCDPTNACCGRTIVQPEVMNLNLAPVSSAVTGTVTFVGHAASAGSPLLIKYQLDVPEHPMHLRYGALLVFIVERFILPSLPGGLASDSIKALLEKVVDCTAIGNSVGSTTVTTVCTNVVNVAHTLLMNKILALDAQTGGDSSFHSAERFYLLDSNLDLTTERLEDGTMTGSVWANGGQVTTFTGNFRGARERMTCAADLDCQRFGLVCRPIADELDACLADTYCDTPVGTVANGGSCVLDANCKSGACIGANGSSHPGTCFTPCADSVDCTAPKICDPDAARIVFVAGGAGTNDDLWAVLPMCAAP